MQQIHLSIARALQPGDISARSIMNAKQLKFYLRVLLVSALGLNPLKAQQTITVTSNADSGTGTLRAAVLQALSDDGVQDEEKTLDTIVFDFGGAPTTITLSTPLLTFSNNPINGPFIIDGAGQDITIDGGTTLATPREQRFMQIGGQGDVTIENLTIQNFHQNASHRGNDGGAALRRRRR